MSENPDPQLKEISDKLSILIQLTVLGLLKDAKTQREKIVLLANAGLATGRIAELVGTTSDTVSKELSVIRKAEKENAEAEKAQSQLPIEEVAESAK